MWSRWRAAAALPVAVVLATAGIAVAEGNDLAPGAGPGPSIEVVPVRTALLSRLGRFPSPGRIRAEYLGAVRSVALSGTDVGVDAVAALEQAVFEGGGAEGLRALVAAEAEIASRLAAVEPAALLALLRLHRSLLDRYWNGGRGPLANHSARLLETLVGNAAREIRDPEVRRAAASIVATAAGRLEGDGIVLRALRLLEAAQHVDPAAPSVIAAAAALHESLGRYDDAVADLQRLLRLEPDSPEARLRLGVNLERRGDVESAIDNLRRCALPGAPPWVRAVAYDELARIAVGRRQWRQAAAILEEAAAAVDDPERALIQLAYVYDRLGRPADAEAVLSLTVAPTPDRSPRYVYAARPAPFVLAPGDAARGTGAASTEALARGIDTLMTPPEARAER